jgi:ferritin-like metal-binding protein YciE
VKAFEASAVRKIANGPNQSQLDLLQMLLIFMMVNAEHLATKHFLNNGGIMALREVLLDELRDMYSAENQLIKALPKLAKGAKDGDLKQLFKSHLEETKGQVSRLKEVFQILGEKPTGQHCSGMEGVIEEGSDALEKDEEGASFDSGLIGAALRTEHYEIAGYQACIAMAKTLREGQIVSLLKENLTEEIAAAKKISAVATSILKRSSTERAFETNPKSSKEKYSAKKSKDDEIAAAPELKRRAPAKRKNTSIFGGLVEAVIGH